MTLIDGIRRAAVGLGSVALVATMASAVQADDLHRPPATGFASVDGVEVEMLVGPTCTWDAPENDRYRHYSRKNVVCNNDDKAWYADAPVLKALPAGDMTYRWATDAKPLFVDTWTANARGAQPAPAGFAATVVWGCDSDNTNPCTMRRADVSSGGVTYIAEARWGETSSTKYAVTLRG